MIWKYYYDSTVYNLGLSMLVAAYAGFLWALMAFGTIGTIVGFIVYAYFREQEYYFYYNYGYSKRMLMRRVWGINITIVIGSLGIYTVIINLF